ncbi:MAG: DUF202 domain-containing protein [Actinomycetota bacterium]|nr:DUF202 domain-containing protein [Actinomycetota bacterium]
MAVPFDDEELPGLAGERTDLAWSRSGLAAVAAVATIAKRAFDVESLTAPALVYVVIAAGVVAWAVALAYGSVLADPIAGRPSARPHCVRYVAYGTTLLALGALVLALLPD